MSEVRARGVNEWTGRKAEGKVPEVCDGGFNGEAVKLFRENC